MPGPAPGIFVEEAAYRLSLSSWPLIRPSTSLLPLGLKGWMPATSAGMTTGVLYFNHPLSRSTVSRQSFSEPAKDRRM